MLQRLALALVLGFFGGPFAFSAPAQVIIIRHAEKPEKGPDLSPRGRQRAAALVPYFLEAPEVLEYKTPVAIYAQKSSDAHPSRRPHDTVKGVAQALKLEVIGFEREDAPVMVKDVMARPEYAGKMVLISWSHKEISGIAKAFGVKDAPAWPDNAFDRLWVINFDNGTATLKNLPQKLMYGDSEK